MKIFNQKALEEGSAKILIVLTYIETLSKLTPYTSKLKNAGILPSEVAYVGLYDSKVDSVGVVDLRIRMQELSELLKVSAINIIVDETGYKDSKGKYNSNLIFTKIFNKDNSLWKHNGILVNNIGDVRTKLICGWRDEAVKREMVSPKLIDSEFILDFNKANIVEVTDGNVAKDILRKLHKENTEISYDTETNHLRWERLGSKLLTVQMTGNNDPYTSYVFFIDHKDKPTTNNMKSVMATGVRWILESGKNICIHNANFDLLWTKKHLCPDLDFYKVNSYDTMLIYHFLTNSIEDVSVGLKESAFVNKVAQDWETDLDEARKAICLEHKIKKEDFSYELFDVDMLARYAGLDTIVLCEYMNMLRRLNENHIARPELDIIEETWNGGWKSIMQSIQWQIWYGMPFDINIAKKQLKEQNETVEKLLNEILEDSNTAKAMEIVNNQNFEKAIKAYQKKVNEALEKGKEFKGKAPDREAGSYGSIKYNEEFNPASLPCKRVLFFDVLKLPIINKTDSGLPACGSDDMLVYCEKYPQYKVLQNFGQITKINKEVGTYLEPFIDLSETSFDGRIRTNFVPLNVSTRMKASSPTLLNLPKTDFKKCVKEANGNFIFQIDYSALEAMLSLNSTKDEARLAQYFAGIEDIHSVNAIIAGKAVGDARFDKFEVTSPEDVKYVKANFPKERQEAKGNLTFLLQYLGSYLGIQAGLKVSAEVAKNIYDGYWNTYSGEKAFILEATSKMHNNGYLRFFGDGVILTPNIEEDPFEPDNLKRLRTPFNAIHQSGAFLTLAAMDRVQRQFFGREGFIPFLSVYDSIIYSCRDEDAIELRQAFLKEMTKEYREDQVVKLKADCEVGSSYKSERDFEGTEEELVEILKEMRNI